MLTPYQSASNDPIESLDADGLERVDFRAIKQSDGTAKLQKAGESPKTDKQTFLGITLSNFPIPYHVRIEYNGQYYLFADGGPESPIANGTGLSANSEFYTNGPVYYAADLNKFKQDPDQFVATHDPKPDFDYADQLKENYRLQIVEGVAELAVGAAAAAHGTPETEEDDELQIAPYRIATRANAGKGLNADHIPSFASLKKMREDALGRDLNKAEINDLRQSALTISIETKLHTSTSLTFGGRNTPARQAADAASPLKAIRDNVNAYRPFLIKQGYSNKEIDAVIDKLSEPFKTKSQ